ncbi:MAG: hypothetical protein A2527_11440 [Candidatus Lambdaproteobacteria bacterium RIFOXYD2_FULL_50_16]|uniref:HEPN domain-containing protein n=1 Tax=Candidatus Lambdaproteobacteria bacterium RIFOXYD2_FULL_50_16 TaxID=1817772 RepID=A0A1F6G6K6_9PROT|nr:MAG: hypothetical protein A2527_11440 [Candidatus Lambdaproteobacteria bacterium RIFOXYD2_FULL_50_16]
MSNFNLLTTEWPDFYEAALKAERGVYNQPRTAAMEAWFTIELAVKWLSDHDSFLKLCPKTS